MKLVSIRGSFFRGFGDAPSISLDSPLVIFSGPNGSGKTAVAEALEWLFFGTTRRKLRGDVDEVEYRGSLRMVECPEGVDPFVEVAIRYPDDSINTLRRTLHIAGTDEWTVASVDGVEVPDFSSRGLVDAEYFYPIIIQDNLQERIRSTGATRRRYISCLLGLEPLIAFDRAVDAACNRFMSSLPQDIARSYEAFQDLDRKIGQRGELQPLHERWSSERVVYPADWNEVLEYCQSSLQMPSAPSDDILAQAILQADLARRAVFDTTPFAPKQNLERLVTSFEQHVQSVHVSFGHLQQSLADYASVRAQIYNQIQFTLDPERLNFWRTGFNFLDVSQITSDRALQCPFCDEMTITQEKAALFQERQNRTDQYTQVREHLQEVLESCCDGLADLVAAARLILPNQLDDAPRNRLEALLPHALNEVQQFGERIQATHTAFAELETEAQEARVTLCNLLALADDPTQIQTVATFVQDTPPTIANPAQALGAQVIEHSASFGSFVAILHPALSSQDTVRHFEMIQYLATTRQSISTASQVLQVREQSRQARQAARDFLRREDRNRIQERGDEIDDWFNTLYGGDPDVVRFGRVDPRGTTMRILGEVLGHTCHASTHFSQSQLNCLGLAMHIVSATAAKCPFGFVLFDDPIQSFGEELRERFIGPVVSRLLDQHQKQLIVLTHLQNVADRLRYGNEGRQPLFYRFEPFSDQGVQVRPFNRLRSASQRIRRRARGDDIERSVACQRLRTFVEHLIKAVYQVETDRAVPREYEDRTGADLVILLESARGFPRPDLDYVRESIMFGVQSSHDDPTWHPPDTQAIAQRMDRLEQVGRNHGLDI